MNVTEARPQPRRRRFSVGLRTLMLLVLAVAVMLGWKVNRARVQRRAVARIEAAGGSVVYDFEFDGTYPHKPVAGPQVPDWLRRFFGDAFFQEVTATTFRSLWRPWSSDGLAAIDDLDHLLALTLHKKALTPTDLERIGRSKSLRDLCLYDADIDGAGLARLTKAHHLRRLHLGTCKRLTDADLASLRGLTELEEFSIIGAPINGPGLACLAALPALRSLHLGACGVVDASLAHLSGLKGLRKLDLGYARITDAGMRHLEGLTELETLKLDGILDITDEGLAHLKGLHRLKSLDLSGTMVTDRGLAHLASLEDLEELNLSADEITDAGLVHLRGLRSLRKLKGASKASDDGISALAGAIPGLKIIRGTGFWDVGIRPARAQKAMRDIVLPPMLQIPAGDQVEVVPPPAAVPVAAPSSH